MKPLFVCINCHLLLTHESECMEDSERQSAIARLQSVGVLQDGVPDNARGFHLECVTRINEALTRATAAARKAYFPSQ